MTISYKEALENFKKAEDALEKARQAELQTIISDIKAKIAEYNLTAEDLGLRSGVKKAVTAKKGEPKFCNPANSSETWSGKGRKPAWVNQHLAQGRSLDELLIAK
ncbi:H-NS family nucleoid-associated regulatory protein [Propionivibrio dicarboxylicus]|uniref:DNA-binding protein H-NS n=1 Tax=Propionivibrio dicarboxylicus TaxID=83767 RepID=A0A1G8D369_9RHOO|nr:H-NS histone family protein [Propionivibrio dicarboxylicus]SDH52121.1 DNA-binding protein H-NS [Propionivibrio dicarboxylicus]